VLYNKSNATANAGGIATGYGTNISAFTTYLNSVMLQYQQLVCANGDDYIFQKPYLEGSSVVSMNDYYNNWFWAEHFTGLNKVFLKDLFPDLDENNLVLGIPLSDQQITYQFNGTSNAALNSWVFFVTQRTVRIDGSNVSFTNMA